MSCQEIVTTDHIEHLHANTLVYTLQVWYAKHGHHHWNSRRSECMQYVLITTWCPRYLTLTSLTWRHLAHWDWKLVRILSEDNSELSRALFIHIFAWQLDNNPETRESGELCASLRILCWITFLSLHLHSNLLQIPVVIDTMQINPHIWKASTRKHCAHSSEEGASMEIGSGGTRRYERVQGSIGLYYKRRQNGILVMYINHWQTSIINFIFASVWTKFS